MALAGSMKGSMGTAFEWESAKEKWDVQWDDDRYRRYKLENLTKVTVVNALLKAGADLKVLVIFHSMPDTHPQYF